MGAGGGVSLPGRPGRTNPGHEGTHPKDASLVGLGRLERPTSRLSGVRSNQLSYRPESHPTWIAAPPAAAKADAARPRPGLKTGRPGAIHRLCVRGRADGGGRLSSADLAIHSGLRPAVKPAEVTFRKEVIQPQVPLRLPCYDFTPVADPTVDGCLPLLG